MMKRIRLGKSELSVSQVGFGGIPIQRVSFAEAEKCIHTALDLGINYIDTALVYSDSEEKIGRALKGKRDKVVLATKVPPRSREFVAESLEGSLKKLKTDYIDLYQLHNVENKELLETSKDVIDILQKAREQGKIRHIGVTIHGVDWANEVIRTGLFETVMIAMNFIVNEAEQNVLPTAREFDVGVIAMKPLAGGHITNAALAMKYFAGFDDVVPLVGIERPEEIKQIVEIVESGGALTDQEISEMEKIKEESGTQFCRRCGYCLPCPQGIDIVLVNTFYSIAKRMPLDSVLTGGIAESMRKAKDCVECGTCEERCPYHLNIRQLIRENYEYFKQLAEENSNIANE
jgi:predicted aldo/keto reductase-like oxidoreductase